MENNYQTPVQIPPLKKSLNKKLLIILLVLFLIIAIIAAFLSKSLNKKSVSVISPTPFSNLPPDVHFPENNELPFSSAVTPLQKTESGKVVAEASLKSYPGFLIKKQISQNKIEYSYLSELVSRPNIIVTDVNSKVIFERELTPIYDDVGGYVTVSEMKKKYGEPERIAKGSSFYSGVFAETHIYSSKGFAYICNPNTDEVLEIHLFEPTTPDQYISNFGDDIDPADTTQIENFPGN